MPRRLPSGVRSSSTKQKSGTSSKEAAWNRLVATLLKLSVEDREVCASLGITEDQFRRTLAETLAKMAGVGSVPARNRAPGKTGAAKTAFAEGPASGIDRIVPIVAHAVAVFGDEGKASHWLSTPLALLDNRTPAQVLVRGDVSAVDQILTRIEHNIPS